MSKIVIKALVVALIISTIPFRVQVELVSEAEQTEQIDLLTQPAPEITKPLSQVEQWKEHLKNELLAIKKTDRDFRIMDAIILCESGWGQYYETGEVKVSEGNIGLAQINRWAHHKEYKQLKLDPYEPLENLSFAVILYKRNGVKDWRQWSGHCWLPILEKQGIYFNDNTTSNNQNITETD